MGVQIERPGAPGSSQERKSGTYRPDQLDADLAVAEMAREIVHKLESPSIISKKFAVRYGLFKALNHVPMTMVRQTGKADVVLDKGNNTGYDCSARMAVYEAVAAKSVNIDGAYFDKIWSYLMKPKFIIQGNGMMSSTVNGFEKEEPGFISKILGFLFGGKKNDKQS